jgi:hypothetical protein
MHLFVDLVVDVRLLAGHSLVCDGVPKSIDDEVSEFDEVEAVIF